MAIPFRPRGPMSEDDIARSRSFATNRKTGRPAMPVLRRAGPQVQPGRLDPEELRRNFNPSMGYRWPDGSIHSAPPPSGGVAGGMVRDGGLTSGFANPGQQSGVLSPEQRGRIASDARVWGRFRGFNQAANPGLTFNPQMVQTRGANVGGMIQGQGGGGGGLQSRTQTSSSGQPGSIVGGGTSMFGGGLPVSKGANDFEDLRGQTFRPPTNTQNAFDQRAQELLGGAGISREFDPQTQQGRDMILKAMQGLQNGPDRVQLAKDAFNIFREETEPQYQQRLRGVGQRASALGRVGAGMTTNDLTGVLGQRNRELGLQERSLINTAAQQIMGDRLNALAGLTSSTGLLGNQTLARDQASAGFDLNRAGLAGQFGQQQFGREQQGRDDLFRERSFQQDLAQKAINNKIQEALLQEQLASGAHNREMDDLNLLTRLGTTGNPVRDFQAASQPPTGPSAYDLGINALQDRSAVSGPAIASRPPVNIPTMQPQPGNIFEGSRFGLAAGTAPRNRNVGRRSIFGNDRRLISGRV